MIKKQIKTLVIMLCITAFMLVAIDSTSAYFTAEEIAHNIITTGGIDIELIEWSEDENGNITPFADIEGVMPGAEISKIVVVKNVGASEAYIRVQVDKYFENETSVLDDSVIEINYNTEKWTEKEGYYYYNDVLYPGETSEPVFTTVSFDALMGNEYQNTKLIIDVNVYATQVANNGDSALTAKGWPSK